MISSDLPPINSELEEALALLDAALLEGRPTDQIEERVCQLAGTEGQHLINTIRTLRESSAHAQCSISPTVTAPATVRAASYSIGGESLQARFGPFEIRERLGSGGAGYVYRAFDTRVGRDVAIKVPRVEAFSDADTRTRFAREARIVAGLRHPSIIPVYEVGESNGLPYLVEEYCPGQNLAQWLRDQIARGAPIDERLAARWLLVLADAVAEVHNCGIVHRDLKPANILLEPTGGTPYAGGNGKDDPKRVLPRITDFGIAKLSGSETALTATHAVLGTTMYMAPEQADGKTRDVGPPADVYSLGAILYELLTGRPPIQADTTAVLLRRIIEDEPTLIKSVRRDVSTDLASICMKCLDKKPEKRYRTAAELHEDLQRFLNGRPVVARPISRLQRFTRWCRRHPSRAALTVVSSIAAIGFVVGAWWHSRSLTDALSVAEDSRREAEVQRDTAERQTINLQRHHFCLDARSARHALTEGHRDYARTLLEKYRHDPLITPNFTWRHLWGLCRQEVREWTEPGTEFYWVEFSPDDCRVVAGNNAGVAIAWDMRSGAELFRLKGHDSCVNAVRYTPDGARLFTASCDGTIRMWDATTGDSLGTFADRKVPIVGLAISPDGSRLVAGELHGNKWLLTLWETATKNQLATSEEYGGRVETLSFATAETLVAGGEFDLVVYEVLADFHLKRAFSQVGDYFHAAQFVPGQSLLAVGTGTTEDKGKVQLFDLSDGTTRNEFDCVSDVRSVALIDDSRKLLAAGAKGIIEVWDWEHEKLIFSLYGHAERIASTSISSDERWCASASLDGTVRIWSLADRIQQSRMDRTAGANHVAFVDGGTKLVVGDGKSARVFHTKTWEELSQHSATLFGTSANPDAATLVTYIQDNAAVWDVRTNQKLGEFLLSNANENVLTLELSADSQWLIRGAQKSLDRWNVSTGEHRQKLLDGSSFGRIAISRQTNRVAFSDAAQNRVIGTIGFVPDKPEVYFSGQSARTLDCQFSPNGLQLAGACEDKSIYLWEVATGKLQMTLTGHDAPVRTVGFSPNGRFIASGDDSGEIRIWDLDAQHENLIAKAHDTAVQSLAFSPDGRLLVSASSSTPNAEGRILVWTADEAATDVQTVSVLK